MNPEIETAIETEVETEVVSNPPALVHTRNEEDQKLLTESFDLTKSFSKVKHVNGLSGDAQLSMLSAASKGTKVVTTGLPLDIAAKVGEITLVRAWSVTKADGSTSKGSKPPQDYFASAIMDADAFTALKATPEWQKAFAQEEPDEDF